jgi:hypothetical protein
VNQSKSIWKKKLVPIMAPPNIGALSQTVRKTRSNILAPHETVEVEEEMDQREGKFDVDAIPSPQIKLVSPTLVEEEAHAPMTADMEIDSHDSEKGQKRSDTNNRQPPTRDEVSHRTNGNAREHTDTVLPRPQPEAGSA